MSEKSHIIAMKKGQSKDQLYDELTRDTSSDSSVNSDVVPDRIVDTVLPRPGSKRHFEMALTDEEASKLRDDPRVNSVATPIEWDDEMLDFEKNPRTSWARDSTSISGRNNWGLLRHIEETNGWGNTGAGQSNSRSSEYYTGHLDGTGVDVVVHEGGLALKSHDEFNDAGGSTRFQEYQWNSQSAVSGANTINYSGSSDDHATHVLSTIGGLNVGWASNAKLYSCPVNSLGGQSYWFDVVKEFHKAKSNESNGYKRPTIMNMSWGYKTNISSVTNIIFRGTTTNTTVRNRDYGFWGGYYSPTGYYRLNCPIYGLSSEVEELEDEGVICVKSAGNQYQKLAVSGDVDYNNYFTRSTSTGNIASGQPLYYNQGSSNRSDNTIIVGAMDYDLFGTSEQTCSFSEKGPRVDVWAAGREIVGAWNTGDDVYDSISGTSMAAPQVAGMVALLAQMNPGLTQVQAREFMRNNAKVILYNPYSDETQPSLYFSDDRWLQGGTGRIAYFPFGQHRPITLSNLGATNFSI